MKPQFLVPLGLYVLETYLDNLIYFQFFDNIRIEDPRVPQYCNLLSEPSPYIILLTCLQKNYGLGDTSITTSMVPARNQQNEFKMKISEKEVNFYSSFRIMRCT